MKRVPQIEMGYIARMSKIQLDGLKGLWRVATPSTPR